MEVWKLTFQQVISVQNISPRKFNSSPLKTSAWKTILSYFGPVPSFRGELLNFGGDGSISCLSGSGSLPSPNQLSTAPVVVLSALGLPKHPGQFQGSPGLS